MSGDNPSMKSNVSTPKKLPSTFAGHAAHVGNATAAQQPGLSPAAPTDKTAPAFDRGAVVSCVYPPSSTGATIPPDVLAELPAVVVGRTTHFSATIMRRSDAKADKVIFRAATTSGIQCSEVR